MKIQVIDHRHALLSDVMILGKQNSKTLGLFPKDAYLDHARKKWIFGAILDGKLAGFILFRITQSKQTVYITQLCIKDGYRNKTVATSLLDQLKSKYGKLLNGIGLSCREDYTEATKLWTKYGFKAIKNERSRSKEEKYLIKWYYDFGNKNLFSQPDLQGNKVEGLLDSNIIMKLCDDPCEANAEAHALQADWLTDEAEYYYAPEIFNEILRDTDRTRADETRKFLNTLKSPSFDPTLRDQICKELGLILPGGSDNDKSDRLQLAECIAGDIEYFITLDKKLLDKTDQVFEAYSVRIVRPADFILFIDHNCRPNDYRSLRFAGANYEYAQLSADELNQLTEGKWIHPGEKKHILLSRLTNAVSNIQKSTVRLVRDKEKSCIGYFAAAWASENLHVTVARVAKTKIAEVLFQQLLRDAVSLAIEKNCSAIQVTETNLSNEQKIILESFGLRFVNDSYVKLIRKGLHLSSDMLEKDAAVKSHIYTADFEAQLQTLNSEESNLLKLAAERQLSPVKFCDIDIPTYIIPIKPYWASQLFDHHIANHSLFGARAELTWNRENIYYRNVNPVSEIAPGRILWYVSSEQKTRTGRESSIVACSYLEEVHVGAAKSLYRKFKNYGIYDWKDITELTGNQPKKNIKALKFVDTEVFKKAVSLAQIQKIFVQHERLANTFASPVKVSMEIFNDIYQVSTK